MKQLAVFSETVTCCFQELKVFLGIKKNYWLAQSEIIRPNLLKRKSSKIFSLQTQQNKFPKSSFKIRDLTANELKQTQHSYLVYQKLFLQGCDLPKLDLCYLRLLLTFSASKENSVIALRISALEFEAKQGQ